MKFETTAYNMEISVTLSDDENVENAFNTVQSIKNLLEELKVFTNVNVSINSMLVDEYVAESEVADDNDMPIASMEQINAQASWPFPTGNHPVEGEAQTESVENMWQPQTQYIVDANVVEDSVTKTE